MLVIELGGVFIAACYQFRGKFEGCCSTEWRLDSDPLISRYWAGNH